MTTCGNRDEAHVSLTVKGAPDSSEVVVSRLAVNTMQVLDTLYISGEKAVFRTEVMPESPEFVYLRYNETGAVSLLLCSGDRVEVRTAWEQPAPVSIEGSEESVLLNTVDSTVRDFNLRYRTLAGKLFEASAAGREDEALKLRRELGTMYVQRKQDALRYIMTHGRSMTVIPVLYQVTPDGQYLFGEYTDAFIMQRVYDSLYSVYPHSAYLAALADEAQARMGVMRKSSLISGAEEVSFPEIVLNDINGRPQSLRALDGKVVVLLFWNSEDVDQRQYNVALKELYGRYSDAGLEIYQVALNTDKTAWAMQVSGQQLPWISVCDPMWEQPSSPARLYNVTALPAMYVISRDGDITARDLFDMSKLAMEVERLL